MIDINKLNFSENTELCQIMTKYGSDKGNGKWHNYTIVYNELFKDLKSKALNIFEVGLGTNNTDVPSNMGVYGKPGASLRGWRDYFNHENTKIFGGDIDTRVLFEEEKIKTYYIDQLKGDVIKNTMSKIEEDFDIIIDDGLHDYEANITFMVNSFHKLKINGYFIIEDILHNQMKLFESYFSNTTYKYQILKLPHPLPITGERNIYDNNLIIVQKIGDELDYNLKDSLIQNLTSKGFTMLSKERLNNLFNQCIKFRNNDVSFVECGIAKGGAVAMMKFSSGKHNKVFGFDSFDIMPDLVNEDIDVYNRDDPKKYAGVNLTDGIDAVYHTFNSCNISTEKVEIVKGYFEDTLIEKIENIGPIGVLRIDCDWYEPTKYILENLYDKVVSNGVIINDDYGYWIGAKKAVDEFRNSRNITSPLIKTDCKDAVEYYWIKE
jgi:hypothetical protein